MDLFEKVALFEKMATELADDSSLPEVSSNEEPALGQELATVAKARRDVIKVRADLIKQLTRKS
jgi:hypothetical protein